MCAARRFSGLSHLLAQLPRFHAVHNEAVRQYRRKYHVRSTSHPVPELAAEGTWLRHPSGSGRPASRTAGVCLRGRRGPKSLSPTGNSGKPACHFRPMAMPVERSSGYWNSSAAACGIRSAPLITTLWARLALGDLFIHGIGGSQV